MAFCFSFSCWYFAFLFLVGLWFLILLVRSISIFCLSSVMPFGFLCPLTIMSKRGRNLRIERHSSGGIIDLGGELHVKGNNVFDVTNLGGELVWYTLILILCCVSLGFVTIYIHHVLFLYLMMMYVFHSLSYICCFFSLFILMFLVYLTCHYFPHGTLMCFFSAFQERQVKAKSRFRAFFLQQLPRFKSFRLGLFIL